MDAADVFRQGLGAMPPRQQPPFQYQQYPYHHQMPQMPIPMPMPPHMRPQPQQRPPPRLQPANPNEPVDETAAGRIAHTLTACCRCRQRKTRCDPTLPRCLPCERSGSVCEYFDASKGRKINRYYVIRLQDKVRALEAELNQFTDEDSEYPRDSEDVVSRGGLVRLNESDDTPRYLGPSSGIAMSRLVMERAKAYTDKQRISDLIPEVRARRQARMQSIVLTNAPLRRKSYPMMSAHPAQSLPTRPVADKLVDMFRQKGQLFWPTLHETLFQQDLEDVYNGDNMDAHKNFMVRMVFAISLQMMNSQYAGLADSYYLAAMQEFEEVIRAKDLRTLQCLLLLAQYSFLTPTRTAVYFTTGLAVRICQQEGLLDEKTVINGFSNGDMDPRTLDLRRRLGWGVAAMELGLSVTMGRPSGIAKLGNLMNVKFFETVSDECITEKGIMPGPVDEKKVLAIHFYKMHLIEAEIIRMMYEKQRKEITEDSHPWFGEINQKIDEWLNSSPEEPSWSKAWFTGKMHLMRIFLYRPSPQIPSPSPKAVSLCHESAMFLVKLAREQMEQAAVDVTWVFMLSLYTAINITLWTVTYAEIRQNHAREEVDENINVALDILDQCTERWPGTQSASQMYSVLTKAIMSSYDSKDNISTAFTPPSLTDVSSPPQTDNSKQSGPPGGPPPQQAPPQGQQRQQQQQQQQQPPQFSHGSNPFGNMDAPQFSYVFGGGAPEPMPPSFAFNESFRPQPTFRSNSIFHNPSTENGRRNSFFPPDSADDMAPCTLPPQMPPSGPILLNHGMHVNLPLNMPNEAMTPMRNLASTPAMPQESPSTVRSTPVQAPAQLTVTMATPPQAAPSDHVQTPQSMDIGPHSGPLPNRGPGPQFNVNQQGPPPPSVAQRPLPPAPNPGAGPEWFETPSPVFSPPFNHNYIPVSATSAPAPQFFPGHAGITSAPMLLDGFPPSAPPPGDEGLFTNLNFPIGLNHMGVDLAGGHSQVAFALERHGSLNQEQQMELMDVLEHEGMNEIDAFLRMANTGVGPGGAGINGGMKWETTM
ncbi:hypothetical protein TD95_001754 [Thielaviopsis punctulata]|uniref:Zn(2)-C6 fungal-type domain-containing protein n=1 Tax=Thielaviopsis punctulata TaxID=72032 RepID=A0A0F4Z730_9PEZI|nr:hypothetical protein TD95_001754 [Thielaviopsis punctulata]